MPASGNVEAAYERFTTEISAMQNEWTVPTFVEDQLRTTATGFSADDFLAEYMLFRAYRAFECLVETVAIQYCLGECTITGSRVESHIRPRDTQHAKGLLRATAKWIEWGEPGTLIKIAENVFRDGFPIKDAVTRHLAMLKEIERCATTLHTHRPKRSISTYQSLREHVRQRPSLCRHVDNSFV